MDRRRAGDQTPGRSPAGTPRRWRLAPALTLALLLTPGCLQRVQKVVQPIEEPVGERRLWSSYHFGTLTVELPPEVRVESATAASRAALARRGYTIRRTEATADAGCVIARPPRGDQLVTVSLDQKLELTQMSVKIEPWGDRAASVLIAEDVLAQLGL